MDSSVNHSSSTHESSDVENDTPQDQDQDPTPLPSKQEVPAPENKDSKDTPSEESASLQTVDQAESETDGQGQLTFDPSIAIEIAQHEARSMEEVIDLSGGFIFSRPVHDVCPTMGPRDRQASSDHDLHSISIHNCDLERFLLLAG